MAVAPVGLVMVGVLLLGGCVTLTPYRTVRQAVPPERFVDLGGQAVHVEQWGSGDALVLLHGFGASSYSWRLVAPELGRDYRVVAPDLNGFGWTQRVLDPAAYTLQGQARLVIGVMDALGIERAHLVGHSYGGGLALWLAANVPDRIVSLILVDSTLPTYAVQRRRAWAALRPLAALFLRSVALREGFVRRGLERSVYDSRMISDEMVAAYLERLKVEGATDAYRGLTAPVEGPPPVVELASIRQPTLVVWGLQDALLASAYGSRAAEIIPHAEFAGIDRCGHLPMEERPEEFVAAVRTFLAARQASGKQAGPPATSGSARK